MDRSKKGNILIEAVAAIFVVAITIILSGKLYVAMKKDIKSEYINYKNIESINAVCNELKYNVNFETLKDVLTHGDIILKYDTEFLVRLRKNELLNLRGDYNDNNKIEVRLINLYKSNLNIKVTLYYGTKRLEEKIEKGLWMDYV